MDEAFIPGPRFRPAGQRAGSSHLWFGPRRTKEPVGKLQGVTPRPLAKLRKIAMRATSPYRPASSGATAPYTANQSPFPHDAGQLSDVVPQRPGGLHGVDMYKLEDLIERVDRLTSKGPDYLMSFWSDELKSFQIVPGVLERPSLMSTCAALQVILSNKKTYSGIVGWEGSATIRVSVREMINTIMNSSWSGDPFQTPELVATLARTRSIDKDEPKYVDAVKKLLEQRSKVSLHRQQNTSSYLRHRNAVALLSLMKNDMVPTELAKTNDIPFAVSRAYVVAFDELARQLAFYHSGDRNNFDVITLALTLMTYYECSTGLYLGSDKQGVMTNTNIDIVQNALGVFFSEQYPDGSFRKGEPIQISADPRDIGNAYVFFFEVMHGMLRMPTELLTPHLHNFERCLQYAEDNIVRELLPGDLDNPYVQGWKSNHVQQSEPVCWATASVLQYLHSLGELLRKVITDDVLHEFKGMTREDVLIEAGGRDCWNKLMDAEVKFGDTTSSLKTELFNRILLPQLQQEVRSSQEMLQPRSSEQSDDVLAGMPPVLQKIAEETPPAQPLYSVILFGPPGTAKTTIVKNMASTINRNFLTIDTANFLAYGLSNIASRMTYVFDKLKTIENTVILFDEIEEFCLDRENPSCTMESRLMTTAMLTQLNNLRREQSNIFVVATNRLRSFDAAVIRPGRFDMLLFVGTPNKDARRARLIQKLSGANIPDQDIDKVALVMNKIWDTDWDELRFSTYAENERLLSEIIALLQMGKFSEDNLRSKIEGIKRTATIQGAVKQDYVESEVLSRV